jgi:hypothetical protein
LTKTENSREKIVCVPIQQDSLVTPALLATWLCSALDSTQYTSLIAYLNLSNFINLTTPGGCRQLSLLTGCAVSLHYIPYLLLRILKIVYGFPNFWPSGFKTIIILNHCKQSITNQESPTYECVCVSVMMSSFKTFAQNKGFF